MPTNETPHYYQESPKTGLEGVTKLLSEPGFVHMTDLDDTVKEPTEVLWDDGVSRKIYPQTVAAFMAEREAGGKIGVMTDQSFTQMEPWLTTVAELALGKGSSAYDLFNGPMIGETGTVVRIGGSGIESGQYTVLATRQAMDDEAKLFEWLMKNIKRQNPTDKWGQLDGVETSIGVPVQLAQLGNEGSLTLWEQGPHVSANPEFIQRYGMIRQRIDGALREMGIVSLETFEAGNGSLRILPRGTSKGKTLERLANAGAVTRKKTLYTCDGYNDVAAAQSLRMSGGVVVAVSNAVPELSQIADYHSTNHSGLGVAEVVAHALPANYERAVENLRSRGLLSEK